MKRYEKPIFVTRPYLPPLGGFQAGAGGGVGEPEAHEQRTKVQEVIGVMIWNRW